MVFLPKMLKCACDMKLLKVISVHNCPSRSCYIQQSGCQGMFLT